MTAAPFRELRDREFPWTADVTYLNNASIGPLPDRTRRTLDAFSARRATPHLLSDRELQQMLGSARAAAARLLNAQVEEIALAPNTTVGVNTAAGSLPIAPGDTVLLSDREFPANVYPWLVLRERGVNVELARTTPQGWPDESYLLERLRDPRVRVLAISFVQFSNGFRADLATLGQACRDNGTYLVVDAIQGLGQCPLDVREIPVDVLACGAQKWLLSPWGAGFVWVRRELIAGLRPPLAGWMAFEGTDDFTRLTDYQTDFRSDARRFEVGTLPFQEMQAMTVSLDLLLGIGIDRIAAYLRELKQPLIEAASHGAFALTSPTDGVHESAIVCVRTDDVPRAHQALREAGVVCVMREGSIRLSPHWYNTPEEIGKVLEILAGA
ncbi:MAG: aminotransferase class V-fold PLP-dependent enzyme [Gemmatimonadales bacterium]|nr:aminotransferase class V-fold PLP-dependent enzyme [Gemmatimonadales bacterium]